MTKISAKGVPAYLEDRDISLLALGSTLLRGRRTIIALAVGGASLGLASGLMSRRVYTASATFMPQGSDGTNTGLAMAASQFGFRIPSTGGGWGPSMYVTMIRSRTLLTPIVRDTITIVEEGGRRIAMMDLLKVDAPAPDARLDLAVEKLANLVGATEDKRLGTVNLTVTTQWPSLSLALAQRMLQRVNQFTLETRKSQAAAERQFVEAQSTDAKAALREAEDQLQFFLQRNRDIAGSPQLSFERDRLQREVTLRQQLYSSWLQSREDARIREVRDTPVITVLEEPRMPIVGEARKSVQKALIAGFAGMVLGILIAITSQLVAGARQIPSDDAREFFRLLEQAKPRLPWQRT